MKIENSQANYTYINQSYGKQSESGAVGKDNTRQQPGAKADSLNISPTTRDLQTISAAAQTEPKERTTKVAQLKAEVEANRYTVNADQVAEKIVGTYLDELS